MQPTVEDQHYLSLRYRALARNLRENYGVDFVVDPTLSVAAAFCPWQQALWVREGIADRPLIALMADAATSIRTSSLEPIRYFVPASRAMAETLPSPTALILPGRFNGRGHNPQHLAAAS